MAKYEFINCLVHKYDKDAGIKIKSPADIYNEMKDIKDASREVCVCFHLDTKNVVIAREIISIGTLNASLVHPREVFRSAIINNSNSIIIAHNHPSGDITPSGEDLSVCKKLHLVADIIGIKLRDFVIIGSNDYQSVDTI